MARPTSPVTLACLAVAALAAARPSIAADAFPRVVLLRPASVPAAPGELYASTDPVAYAALWEGSRSLVESFPLPDGRLLALDVRPFQVIAPGARFVRVGSAGTRTVAAPAIRFLRGEVVGQPGSRVVLTLFQGRVLGEVSLGDEAFGVGPERVGTSHAAAHRMRVWERSREPGEWSCGVADFVVPTATIASIPSPEDVALSGLGDPQLALRLAVESTEEWCEHHDDDAEVAEAYLLAAIAVISATYDDEIRLLVQVSFLRTFCGSATDPYTDGLTSLADRSQLLAEFSDEWEATMGAVDRSAAQLYSWSDSSSAGGLAYTHVCQGPSCSSVLCNEALGYGVLMLPASGGNPAAFEIRVAAHELGHNHSSPHTNCLQDASSTWVSICAAGESCGSNPHCQAHDCYPGPANPSVPGTMMSAGCATAALTIADDPVEGILRAAAEAASCIETAGLPGGVRESSGGLRIAKVEPCPVAELRNDDGGLDQFWGAGSGQIAWIKRYTPGCYPYRLTRVDAVVPNVSPGRPLRLVVYADPAGTGNPSAATLVHSEDVTVQVSSLSAFNLWVLANPWTVAAGDLYIGLYDLQIDAPPPFIAALDNDTPQGDSFRAFNSTAPGSYGAQSGGTWMIRGQGGPVPAGTLALQWGPPCNAASVPGQDYGVYRGDMPVFDAYESLVCTTGSETSYVAEAPPDGSFFLVVPATSAVEGSYGLDGDGAERPPAARACKPQDPASCR
jgi:hypothetical protein